MCQTAHDVATDDVCALLEIEGFQVLAQDSKTTGLPIYEDHSGRSARQRLDAKGT